MRTTQRLGRYQLTDRIGHGGMAEIFRAFTYTAEGHRRDIAVKKLLPHYVEDQHFIDMLLDEFKLVSHLKHPGIAEVFEMTRVQDALLIAMEFVDGKDLRSTVEKARASRQLLDLDDLSYVVARALDGLHHAHGARDEHGEPLCIVHRDFSPSNILVGYDGHIKLCDFGVAKARNNRVKTKTGIIKGKVKYMSPEQAFGQPLDFRSDLFSAGSVLYELATGRPPFTAKTEIDLIFAVRDAEPIPCQVVNPRVPDALAHIIERSMHRSRSARYQSGAEFRDALLNFIRQYNPRYKRTKFSSFLRTLWAEEIEKELRAMESVVIDESSPRDLGRNLLADVLGPNATYSRFTPRRVAPGPAPLSEEATHADDAEAAEATSEGPMPEGAPGRSSRPSRPVHHIELGPHRPSRPPERRSDTGFAMAPVAALATPRLASSDLTSALHAPSSTTALVEDAELLDDDDLTPLHDDITQVH